MCSWAIELRLARREHYLKVGEDGTTKVVHRVAIFDARGCITSVISQLDVMRCALRRQAAPMPCLMVRQTAATPWPVL